jgi:hypothetical protein
VGKHNLLYATLQSNILQGDTARQLSHFLFCMQAGAAPQQQQPPAAAVVQQKQQQQQLAGTKRPAAGTDGAAADAAVPKGFFDDKTADKKARGIKE